MLDTAEILNTITTCNDSGRLALAVYLVHGYPSLERSKQAFDLLQTHKTTIFECGLPVDFSHGSSMSAIIEEAHSVILETGLSDDELLSFYAGYRPNILMHTQDDHRQDAKKFHGRIQGEIDAVITENVDLASMLDQPSSDQKSPLLVHFVSALSESPERDINAQTRLVYLGIASRIGGELLPSPQIQSAVDKVAKAAPNAKILCGFGIRTASDVKRLSRIRGIHGLAIGTEALRVLKEGITDFENWLLEINRELVWTE